MFTSLLLTVPVCRLLLSRYGEQVACFSPRNKRACCGREQPYDSIMLFKTFEGVQRTRKAQADYDLPAN